MNVVPDKLAAALRRVVRWFNQEKTNAPKTHQRPIPDIVREKYHRAIWAIDLGGVPADADRWKLREIWQNANYVAANADGPEGGMIADDLIKTLAELCEAVLRAYEKDPNRAEWQKQRDFLVGTMRRVRRATQLVDIGHFHFYKRTYEAFNVDLQHPKLQIDYHMWQGILRELKEAISFAEFRANRPTHPQVQFILESMRRVIRAMEFNDFTGFEFYDPAKSPLHLSPEQEGRMLWEAVREEIAKTVALAEAQEAA